MIHATMLLVSTLSLLAAGDGSATLNSLPLGPTGLTAIYHMADSNAAASVVETLTATLGPQDEWQGTQGQWLYLKATKKSGVSFEVRLLCRSYPSESLREARRAVLRFVLLKGDEPPMEYRNGLTGLAVLPATGAWPYLLPRAEANAAAAGTEAPFPATAVYLGHRYTRTELRTAPDVSAPAFSRVVQLRPDLLIGMPHDMRQTDETRRYDGSDYEYVPLLREDYKSMMASGLNCFHATPEQAQWLEDAGVFFWGVGGKDLLFPECLYLPQYLGSNLYLDEPAVTTRDAKIRPRFQKEPAFRHAVTPQEVLAAFKEHYADVIANGAPAQLLAGLAQRDDVDLGSMRFRQGNLYCWETMVSTAAHELSYDAATPDAVVFEPPGRVGARRMLPSMNMSYGCQIPVTNTNNLADIIIGFLRGAARATGKEWGISIYGGVDTVEAPAFLARAYDLGATRFFYWDSYQLACVPFGEVLKLSRQLTEQARSYPDRNLDRLLHAADEVILLPPGYDLGHVHMGLGNLWGLPELNLERRNSEGVTYRTVMGNFFTEIERCLRLGVPFDLLWDLPGLKLEGYREVVRIREDGKVQLLANGKTALLDGPRIPERPEGQAPQLRVEVSAAQAPAPSILDAVARINEGASPVYYSPYPDAQGVHHNSRVRWDLFGPEDEDYTCGMPVVEPNQVSVEETGEIVVRTKIHLEKPGTYRLRTATTDLSGKTAVVWTDLKVGS